MELQSDLETFNQLFSQYRGRFVRFACTYVRDLSVAEDFTMEAFVYYWEHRHQLTPGSNVPAYLLTIIKHKCLNHLEHQQVEANVAEQMREHAAWALHTRIATLQACEPEELFSADAQAIVRKTLRALPVQSRRIFIMSRYRNKTHKEIASAFHISVKGVEFHIGKALKALRHNLKDYLPTLFF